MFIATTTNKSGSTRQTGLGETRNEAARIVFEKDPKAKNCSTAIAHKQADGSMWNTGQDMRWQNRQS